MDNFEIMELYNKLHEVCPECGDDRYSSTYMPIYIGETFEETKNSNKCCCHICGWKGIIHDLVARSDYIEKVASSRLTEFPSKKTCFMTTLT